MPDVNIKIGGVQTVIPLPNYAMEATQKDVLEAVVQLQAANKRKRKENKQSTDEVIKAAGETRNAAQRLFDSGDKVGEAAKIGRESFQRMEKTWGNITGKFGTFSSSFSKGAKTLERFASREKFSDQASSFFNMIQMPVFAGIMGTGIGIVEKFGESMTTARRVGIGVGEDFTMMRSDVGRLGLSLGQFTDIVTASGPAVKSLGENTAAGAKKLIKLNAEFARQTQKLGYFGLSATDMAQILIQEVDLRRKSSTTEQMANLDVQKFSKSLSNNILLQEKMARLTGDDVQERLAARQQALSDVNIQTFLRTASEEDRNVITAISTDLTLDDETKRALQMAFINNTSVGVFSQDAAKQNALLGGRLDMLLDYFRNRDNSNLEETMTGYRGELGNVINFIEKELPDKMLTMFGGLGDQVFQSLQKWANDFIHVMDVEDEMTKTSKIYADAAANGEFALSGLAREAQVLQHVFKSMAMDFVLATMGIDVKDFGQSILLIQDGLANAANSPEMKTLVSTLGSGMATYTGMEAMLRSVQRVKLAKIPDEKLTDKQRETKAEIFSKKNIAADALALSLALGAPLSETVEALRGANAAIWMGVGHLEKMSLDEINKMQESLLNSKLTIPQEDLIALSQFMQDKEGSSKEIKAIETLLSKDSPSEKQYEILNEFIKNSDNEKITIILEDLVKKSKGSLDFSDKQLELLAGSTNDIKVLRVLDKLQKREKINMDEAYLVKDLFAELKREHLKNSDDINTELISVINELMEWLVINKNVNPNLDSSEISYADFLEEMRTSPNSHPYYNRSKPDENTDNEETTSPEKKPVDDTSFETSKIDENIGKSINSFDNLYKTAAFNQPPEEKPDVDDYLATFTKPFNEINDKLNNMITNNRENMEEDSDITKKNPMSNNANDDLARLLIQHITHKGLEVVIKNPEAIKSNLIQV